MSDSNEGLSEKYRIKVARESKDFAVGAYDNVPQNLMEAALNHLGELGYEAMFLGRGDDSWVVTFRRGGLWSYKDYNLEAGGFNEQRLATITEIAVRAGATVLSCMQPDGSRRVFVKSRVYDAIEWG